ncbi:MAG TPA: hypothetical protein VLC47_05895 [Burkholderiales bacterium]|nr:hypothetical protein [Burkholderiales bacterium]
MRTRIRGGWVAGHERGAHTLDRNYEIVFEGGEILYVGPAFEGRVDREIVAAGKLVAPGFIDTHVHSGHRASHRLISDAGRGDYFGQPFLEISVPKEGTRIDGDVRRGSRRIEPIAEYRSLPPGGAFVSLRRSRERAAGQPPFSWV